MNHDCPYLENGRFCTHKSSGLRCNKAKRRLCGYKNPKKCRLFSKSRSVLTTALIALGRPFGLGVEE